MRKVGENRNARNARLQSGKGSPLGKPDGCKLIGVVTGPYPAQAEPRQHPLPVKDKKSRVSWLSPGWCQSLITPVETKVVIILILNHPYSCYYYYSIWFYKRKKEIENTKYKIQYDHYFRRDYCSMRHTVEPLYLANNSNHAIWAPRWVLEVNRCGGLIPDINMEYRPVLPFGMSIDSIHARDISK